MLEVEHGFDEISFSEVQTLSLCIRVLMCATCEGNKTDCFFNEHAPMSMQRVLGDYLRHSSSTDRQCNRSSRAT